MTDLIKRLEAASAGSRELDQLVWCACNPHHKPFGMYQYTYDDGEKRWRGGKDCPPVSTSLDAATALAERVLPGWKWSVNQLDYGCTGWVKPPLKTHGDLELQDLGEGAAHASACIALTIATLKAHALLQKKEAGE